jgi:sec-independent protein translocase protein TatB
MFDFGLGSTELLLVAMIALIVIGPKDLPRLLRTMGQYMRKIQGMAREFQNHLNEAAKEAGVDDVKKEVKGMTNFTVTADLDKQGAEIKKAIESSASKASPASQPNGAKADPTTDGKDEPAKLEAAKPAGKPQPAKKSEPAGKPETASKPKPAAKAKAAAKPNAAAKPKADSKPKAETKPAAKPKTKSKPKSAAKPKASTGPKVDPARETAKS